MKDKLLAGSLLVASVGGAMAQTPPSSGGLAAKLQPFIDDQTMAGAVMLVATKDKILDLEAVGYSDLAAKTPMTTQSFFWIASMSKAMTASALMMLVDEGKVSVDDPVEKYLPEFQGQMVADPKDPASAPHSPSHPITIREILSHTSGLSFRTAGESGPLDTHPPRPGSRQLCPPPAELRSGYAVRLLQCGPQYRGADCRGRQWHAV